MTKLDIQGSSGTYVFWRLSNEGLSRHGRRRLRTDTASADWDGRAAYQYMTCILMKRMTPLVVMFDYTGLKEQYSALCAPA